MTPCINLTRHYGLYKNALDIYSLLKIPAYTVSEVKTQRPLHLNGISYNLELISETSKMHCAGGFRMFLSLTDRVEFLEKLDSADIFGRKNAS